MNNGSKKKIYLKVDFIAETTAYIQVEDSFCWEDLSDEEKEAYLSRCKDIVEDNIPKWEWDENSINVFDSSISRG